MGSNFMAYGKVQVFKLKSYLIYRNTKDNMLHKLMIGSRKIGPTTKRFLGQTNKSIKVLGSVTNAINQVGITSPFLSKVNNFKNMA